MWVVKFVAVVAAVAVAVVGREHTVASDGVIVGATLGALLRPAEIVP